MARTADKYDILDAGGNGAVIAVAIVARRGPEAAEFRQVSVVNTPLVFLLLVGGNSILLHESRIGMTFPACFCYVQGVGPRPDIRNAPCAVRLVTTGANRDFFISPTQKFSMRAGQVALILVYPDVWIIPLHEFFIPVAPVTEYGDFPV